MLVSCYTRPIWFLGNVKPKPEVRAEVVGVKYWSLGALQYTLTFFTMVCRVASACNRV